MTIFDCVTIESQPSLRGTKGEIAKAPEPPAEPNGATAFPGERPNAASARQDTDGVDKYGNAKLRAEGTIPMHRISLERLSKFATVKDFRAKTPSGAGGSAGVDAPTPPSDKRHSHGAENIFNSGGSSIMIIWDVQSYFAVSQQWYIALSTSSCCRQTVESGTLDFQPGGPAPATLFIYYTDDNYYYTGCYNLGCPGFVQVNNNWAFGNRFAAYSVVGGTQIELKMQWKYTSPNWWLYLYRGTVADAVGYYPGSAFGGGPMTIGAAERVDYGGEANIDRDGNRNGVKPLWGQMGSGGLPYAGFGTAAYHRKIFAILPSGTSQWTYLTPGTTSTTACYDVVYFDQPRGGAYASHLYFGGPGSFYYC